MPAVPILSNSLASCGALGVKKEDKLCGYKTTTETSQMLIALAVSIGRDSWAVTVDEMSTLKSHALSDMRKELEGRYVSILYESPQVTILSKQMSEEFRQKVNLLQSEVSTIRWKIRKELSDLNRHIQDSQSAISLASGRIAGLSDAEIARFDFTHTHGVAMRHQRVFREVLMYMAKHAPLAIYERYQLMGERLGMTFTKEEAEDYRYPLLQQFPERFPLETGGQDK